MIKKILIMTVLLSMNYIYAYEPVNDADNWKVTSAVDFGPIIESETRGKNYTEFSDSMSYVFDSIKENTNYTDEAIVKLIAALYFRNEHLNVKDIALNSYTFVDLFKDKVEDKEGIIKIILNGIGEEKANEIGDKKIGFLRFWIYNEKN